MAALVILSFPPLLRLFSFDTNVGIFYPAGRALLEGHNPYEVPGFFNPPWSLVVLTPLSLFPPEIARVVLALMSFSAFCYVGLRFRMSPVAYIAFLLSPSVLLILLVANLDGLMLLGLLMPPPVGLFFVLLKPQFGAVIALFWFVESWRAQGWRGVVRTFAPVAVVSGLSLPLFGLWPLSMQKAVGSYWNMSLFPWSIIPGILLLYRALRSGRIGSALPAALFLSPYVSMPTWSGALLSLASHDRWMVVASMALWADLLLRLLLR